MKQSSKAASIVAIPRSGLDGQSGGLHGPNAAERSEGVLRPTIDRFAWVSATAYAIAQRRGFAPGHELDDWLEAEKQVRFEIAGEGRTF